VQKIEKVVVVSGSRELQKAELQNIQLVVVMYSVGLTLRHVAGSKACIAGYSAAVLAYYGHIYEEGV